LRHYFTKQLQPITAAKKLHLPNKKIVVILKHILLFGAGKSATYLIQYLINNAQTQQWHVTIADVNKAAILAKTNNHPSTTAVAVDINNAAQREALIEASTIVISMLPPALHLLVAKNCLQYGKHLLTASYIDDSLQQLAPEIEKKGLLFLCEMGLDPGIDHMSAMQIIDAIHQKGGQITSFKSHCGGLIAPESDNNPWQYKITWNPRNIVLAGKDGAVYKQNNTQIKLTYEQLFNTANAVHFNTEVGTLCYYPNRDSLSYTKIYGLENAATFLRTTLRYPNFMLGWQALVSFGLTSQTESIATNNLTIAQFFSQTLTAEKITNWLAQTQPNDANANAKVAYSATGPNMPIIKMLQAQNNATANVLLAQLMHLGLQDGTTLINKGDYLIFEVLQFIIETKLALAPTDKDMVAMLHEFEYTLDNKHHTLTSKLLVKGETPTLTAMAKTVGLPLGIAAKLILNNTIQLTGLHVPTSAKIYDPVLAELVNNNIIFTEIHSNI
jgi:saccharopine dehydrogenase-like NADP-dependent oxidoreductase